MYGLIPSGYPGMASSDSAFVTKWRVEATIEELAPGDPQSQIGRLGPAGNGCIHR